MCQLTIAVSGFDSVQACVQNARELALRSPEAWANAWHNTYGQDLNRAVFAGLEDADDAHFGRVVRQVLRNEVIRAATDRAKDELAEQAEVKP